MKYLLFISLCILFIVGVVWAQNESFSGSTTAWRLGSKLTFDNTVTLNDEQGVWSVPASALKSLTNAAILNPTSQVWTNDVANGGLIYPSGTIQTITTPFYFNPAGGGSLFMGTNVQQDISGGLQYALDAVTMTDSNEPPDLYLNLNAVDSENYGQEANFTVLVKTDPSIPTATIIIGAYGTNTQAYHSFNFQADPGSGRGGTFLNLSTNIANKTVWMVDSNGVMTSNGYIDNGEFSSSTNTFSGATNTVNMLIYRQSFQTVTPCQFSGYINSHSDKGSEVQVSIYNNSSSNITVTYGQGVTDRDFNSQVTITNGNKGIFWLQVDPSLKKGTNIVFNQF